MDTILVNLPFVGSVAQWALMADASATVFETSGPYQRRTARTRTMILSKDGPLCVSLPVHIGHGLCNKEVRLNYEKKWQKQLLYALQTAYNPTPYFEFFFDDYRLVIEKDYEFLWDFNMDIFETTARLAGLSIPHCETTEFAPAQEGQVDLRIAIETRFEPVMNNLCFPTPYSQVFALPYTNRPFTPWLSMLDLLFNMGPECRDVLRLMRKGIDLSQSY